MIKSNKIKLSIFAALTISLITFIFFMSSQSISESKGTSGTITDILAKLFYGDEYITNQMMEAVSVLVRKTAHMGAFFLMFILSYGTLFYYEKSFGKDKLSSVKVKLLVALGFVLLNAAFDEFHQIFSGRGALVVDVFIDMVGASIGAVLIIGFVIFKGLDGSLKKVLGIAAILMIMFILYSSVFIFIHPEILTIMNN